MSPTSRTLFRGAVKLSSSSTTFMRRRPISSFNKTPPAPNKGIASEQAMPLGPYYEAIIVTPQPIPETKPEEPPSTSAKAPRSAAKRSSASAQADSEEGKVDVTPDDAPRPETATEPKTAQEKAKIIFGTRLAGPEDRAERLKALRAKSTLVAGILVPPKPEEPDNCCMSGCVNCVWDLFRDELEEWASATKLAEKRLQAQRAQGPPEALASTSAVKGVPGVQPSGVVGPSAGNDSMSMDDDGGGSETNWEVKDMEQAKVKKDFWDEDLYAGVPVGIREFMKTEKKLKKRHTEEGSIGG